MRWRKVAKKVGESKKACASELQLEPDIYVHLVYAKGHKSESAH